MEKELPYLIAINIDDIIKKFNSFTIKNEKNLFLKRIIRQYNIDEAMKVWDLDCVNCVKQFKTKQAWKGFFDAMFGDFDLSKATNKESYLYGKKHYKDYIMLCELLDEIKTKQNVPPPQPETGTPTFTNTFDNIKPTEIYKHFKASLVEKGYLTEQELNEYLKAAFELKTKPETPFKLKHTPTKQKIYTVFYIYYKDISQKKHKRQKEYAALLGDFFEGYKTEIIQTNWARDYKTKR